MHNATEQLFATVEISIDDEIDPFARVTGSDGDTFRSTFVPGLFTEDDVLAYWGNCAAKGGFLDVSELDGWADLAPGIATLRVVGLPTP
jgi:hypothetical protein